MTFQPVIADSLTPNDSIESGGQTSILSIDGYITTKFSSVGDTVEIFALTRGHSLSTSGSTNTIVTADILHYPENDPIGIITQGEIPSDPMIIDTVVMQSVGLHDNDSSTMVWEGEYTVPFNALGGVYGANITAEEGALMATDNPTQIPELVIGEIETVLQAVDTMWDTINPTMDIKAVFDNLNSAGADNGGWVKFVNEASRQPGVGGSGQFWDNMIYAGYNTYDMGDGAKFLESLMEFLESSDLDAGMAFLTGLLVYADEFPLPRTINDFQTVAEYFSSFDPIENFTRFSGTDEFSVAYDAMLGSGEWAALEQALDNLANNTKVFESFQTILHNMALLSVSIHPEAIMDGFEAWIAPLRDNDFNNMTPLQKLILSWSEMDVTVHDFDDDGIPEEIIWEYELLLNTSEGLQWQAKMDTTYPYISDGFDDFNSFDVEIINLLNATIHDPAWDAASNAVMEFEAWLANASMNRNLEWEYPEEEEEEEGGGSSSGGQSATEYQYVIFEELYPVKTTLYDQNIMDLGFRLSFDLEGDYDSLTDYPADFNVTVTQSDGSTSNLLLVQKEQYSREYFGRLTASSLGEETYAFSQPLETYYPPCANTDKCKVRYAKFRIETLRPSLMETMMIEVIDEIFLVSAVGVLVEQDETFLTLQPLTVNSTTYDATTGAIYGAEVDTAILRISPGLAESAFSTLSPDGEFTLTNNAPSTLSGSYSGDDVDGLISVEVGPRGENEHGKDMSEDPVSYQGDIGENGTDGQNWDLSSIISSLPYDQRGVATITTSGTTDTGLNFKFIDEVPLPRSPGCAIYRASKYSDHDANIGWRYGNFYSDGVQYDKTDLLNIEVDWGDGATETFQITAPVDKGEEDWANGHSYSSTDGIDEYLIDITFNLNHSVTLDHQFKFKEYHGIERSDDDGNTWHEDYAESDQEWNYCRLNEREHSNIPSPSIVNEFITDGPFEVMDEQISTSDSMGKASLTVTPPHTGVYVTIVQSKYTRSSDGETLTGMGMNLGAATQGTISLGGMDIIDYFAGLPVYAANTSASGLLPVEVQATGIEGQNHKVSVGLLPVDLSIPFPDIASGVWDSEEIYDLQFTSTDTSRTQEVRFTAPLSLIGAISMTSSDEDWEEVEDPFTPLAMHLGLVVNNPEELNITGTLGPGQTTNIALHEDIAQATRILAVASPSQGFDPATIDFSTISELIWQKGLRPEVGWIAAEESTQRFCENVETWQSNEWDGAMDASYVFIRVAHQSDIAPYVANIGPIDLSNAELRDDSGTLLTEVGGAGATGSDQSVTLKYEASSWTEGQIFTFNTNTDWGSSIEFEMNWEDDELRPKIIYEDKTCGDDYDLTEGEIFDIFDQYVGRLSSIAWGQGTSADMKLPHLSSPLSEYTVIGVAQQGVGPSANLVAAVSTTLSEPNPEPPQIQNLSLIFTPQNPSPGDIVLITITDESNNPVEGLSITLVRDNLTLSSLLSDETGQNSFAIPVGTIIIRISGGQYYPIELTIIVNEDGLENGSSLPGDIDGDGVGDLLDAFPNDATEWKDTDNDNIGDNADTDDDGDGLLDTAELSAVVQTNPLSADTDNDGYCDGQIPVQSVCVGGDVFPTDSSEWEDSDGDGIGDNSDETPLGGNEQNQTNNTTNNTNQTIDSGTTNDQDEGSSDSTSTNMVLIGGSIAFVILILIAGLAILFRGKTELESGKWAGSDDSLFDDPGPNTSPPGHPPVTERGEMVDGYEAIEYPSSGGTWYYRDQDTGQWVEWK